jgi:hypothetical protein
MLEKQYNGHLCFRLAVSPDDVAELMAKLPETIVAGLAKDLEDGGEAEKYDLATQTAYSFRTQGTALVCWSWCDVRTYGEAGRLLTATIESGEPMNPLLACQLYTAATNRPSVLDPEHMPRDGGSR